MTKGVQIYCFPFAGGSSSLYKEWVQNQSSLNIVDAFVSKQQGSAITKANTKEGSILPEVHLIDYPGSLLRPQDLAMDNIPDLAQVLVKEYFTSPKPTEDDDITKPSSPIILYGHSFGAIVAFEVAKLLETDYGYNSSLLTLIVSASRPPSATSLTSSTIPVSSMKLEEMANYFESRGNAINPQIKNQPEMAELFVSSVSKDYYCLETYPQSDYKLHCPVFVFGGENDPGVSVDDLHGWKSHIDDTLMDQFIVHVFADQGHYFLGDANTSKHLSEFIAERATVSFNGVNQQNHVLKQEIVDVVIESFAKVLQVGAENITLQSNFFDMGGSSLDTMALTVFLKSSLGIYITQNEFFQSPSVEGLAIRIGQLQKESSGVPMLSYADGTDGQMQEKYFPASNGQEQMVSCWEVSPAMYNMPTTIEFQNESMNEEALRKSIDWVIKQQPSLRTIVRIDPVTNEVHQRVFHRDQSHECFELKVVCVDDEEAARLVIETESLYCFNLTKPPVFRAVLVKITSSSASASPCPTKQYLLLNQHHVGSDGWSRTILRRQLLKAYLYYINGEDESDQSLPVIPSHPNYVEWTLWARRWLYDYGQQEKQIKYWKHQLDCLPVLDLPTDYPRPKVLSSKGMCIPIMVNEMLTSKLKVLVAKYNTSLYSGLIALYAIVLHLLGGGNDFAIGVALANRHHEGLNDLVGYFANEIAIRAQFNEDGSKDNLSYVDILTRIRENVLEGMANADVPFHNVVEALQIKRDGSRTSVFQVMFALQEREWHSVDDLCPQEGNLRFQLKKFNHNTSKFEVHLQLRHDGSGGLEGDLHIATDLFTKESGERIVEAYLKLIQCCVDDPEKAIMNHDILPKCDVELIQKCNSTDVSFKCDHILARIEANDKGSIAFFSDDDKDAPMTYGQFLSTAQIIAKYLHTIGVKHGQRVGILMKNSAQALCVIFGIMMCGCSNVIQDPEKTPVDRCKVVFDDADVTVAFVDEDHKDRFEQMECSGREVQLMTVSEVDVVSDISSMKISSWNTNYEFGIFYTSGTTGMPKGVIITMSNVTNLVDWWSTFFELNSSDRVLLFSSLSFIMSLRQYIPTLCAGGSIVIPKTTLGFESAISSLKVTKLVCTPSALASLDAEHMRDNGVIQAVQVAGEAPQLNTMETWKGIAGRLFIGLGPTETCAHSLCGEFDGETISIGHPASNVRAYIVNPSNGKQVPVNTVGELWISGRNISNGYLNRKEETEARFSLDPDTGHRLYKTGDLARRLSDGRVQFIGRSDQQIKVNGFRIEKGDIINAMPPDVKNAHVAVEDDRLVAYVAPSLKESFIIESLKKALPTYMIPSKVIPIEKFPLNKNNKLDVKQLLQLAKDHNGRQKDSFRAKDDSNSTADASYNKVQETIRLVWTEILQLSGTDELCKCDNFFEKGGTSLSAVIASRKLSKELNVDINVQEIFSHQTIEDLSDHISKTSSSVQHYGEPSPLVYLPGGRNALNPVIFGILQAIGLFIMSAIAGIPVLAMVFVSVRSFIWYGKAGIFLFPSFLIAGCIVHMGLVLIIKWAIIGKYKSGKAKVFSWMFLKWWMLRRVLAVTHLYTWTFDESVFSRLWMLLLGVDIGKGVSIEQAILLEPDLVQIGDNCTVEFETQFATSEIRDGHLELRPAVIGSNVSLGVRSVLLGGAKVHDGCKVGAKTTIDFNSSSTEGNQVLIGSPATIKGMRTPEGLRPQHGFFYSSVQFIGIFMQLFAMSGIVFGVTSIGLVILEKYGSIGLVIFLGSSFNIIASFAWLGLLAVLHWLLIPRLEEGKVYGSKSFLLRKWFVDRLLLSPLFTYASQRVLQTSSTFPWYMQLLGAKVGKRAWINHPYMRVGIELVEIGDEFHMGMLNYLSSERWSKKGVTFHKLYIGDHSSFGQRCVAQGGAFIGDYATVGAETLIPHDFNVNTGGTTFGCPPVLFTSNASFQDIVDETQKESRKMVEERGGKFHDLTAHSFSEVDNSSDDKDPQQKPSRMQDIGKGGSFWIYVITMILIQACIPLLIGVAYGGLYFFYKTIIDDDVRPESLILVIPVIYVVGTIFLMGILKVMQMMGGSFSYGTANFFSFRFFYWHVFADMVYLCTSTVIYPFSGTELYCMWLRMMGARVGKQAFVSPENGGFREIDFMDIGNNAVLMTPNIHAHYTDHGVLQFCPVKFEDGVEINPGATIMPLTKYGKNSRLRPFAVTVKGQQIMEGTEYIGNPCKAIKRPKEIERVAVLFPGQGSQYIGMLSKFDDPVCNDLIQRASAILGVDLLEISSISCSNPSAIDLTMNSQPLVFVSSMCASIMMRRKYPLYFSKVIAVAGISLGELTALCFAGAISFEDCVNLVRVRATAMSNCNGGAMCNVRGMKRGELVKLCGDFNVKISNILCDHDNYDLREKNVYICSGKARSIDQLVATVNSYADPEKIPVKAKRLNVSGAFHTKAMKPAQEAVRNVLKKIHIALPENHLVYSNVKGRPYRSAAEIRLLLVDHLVSPVQWHKAIHDMQTVEGVNRFLECGPSTSLAALLRRIDPQMTLEGVISSDDRS